MLPEVIPSVGYPAGHVDTEAFAQLNELVAALARELADTELVPRRLAGKLWPVFARALAEPITPEGRQRFCTACFSRHSSVVRSHALVPARKLSSWGTIRSWASSWM